MLKMTDIESKKISDIDKHLYIEKWLTGGISYISNRYSKANNKYLNDYDPKKPSKFIIYLDIPIGYILEVHLKYPDKLHELHNDFPLAPEKFAVSNNMLSNYCKKIADNMKWKLVM